MKLLDQYLGGAAADRQRVYLYFLSPLLLFAGLCVFSTGYAGYHQAFRLMESSAWYPLEVAWYVLGRLGEGGVLAAVLLLLVLPRAPHSAVLALLSLIVVGLLVQVLKHQVFADWVRPAAYFDFRPQLHLGLQGWPPLRRSFPSGHAAALLATALPLTWWLRGHVGSLLGLAVGLVLMTYSRIGAWTHFPADLMAGWGLALLVVAGLWPFRARWAPAVEWVVARRLRIRFAQGLGALLLILTLLLGG